MEIGSLADWFTGCATLTAVLTTLFFTFYRSYKANKKSKKSAIHSILKLAEDLYSIILEENLNKEQVKNSQQYKMFYIYLMVMTFTGSEAATEIVEIGETILDCLSKGNTELSTNSSNFFEYSQLLSLLKNY